ncbi:hypothetical protein [Cylindrospermopsis raciborskii]|uniref:hypothetical protein n=1 Tax=Cylindrospermopsis raciborskii TaxID=77022 RepID=UPI000778AE40|nr:hypothetical protein [Cylindrospermopsis raciborskii]
MFFRAGARISVIYYPDGSRFLSPVELSNYAEQERLLKEQEQLKYQTLLAQLKAKGIDITTLE